MEESAVLDSIPCPICGNDKLQTLLKRGQFGLPCYVSICPSDGLVFLSPRWTKERYMRFYQKEYDSYYRPKIFQNEADDSKYKNIKQICSRLNNLNLMLDRESILDVGAGMGWSIEWLEQNYPCFNRFSTIESSQHCINNLENIVGTTVLSNDVCSDWISTEFDLIIMRHTLEHFLNPVEALKKVAENLSSNGIVYIAVPDMMNPKGSLKNWFISVHTFYFSKNTLISIASLAGLQPVEIQSENSEVWSVFIKATNSVQNQSAGNEFEKQIRSFKIYQRWNILRNAKYTIIRIFFPLIPRRAKTWLKNQYHRLKK